MDAGHKAYGSVGRGRFGSVQSDSALLDNGLIRKVKSEVNLFRTKSLNFKSKLFFLFFFPLFLFCSLAFNKIAEDNFI